MSVDRGSAIVATNRPPYLAPSLFQAWWGTYAITSRLSSDKYLTFGRTLSLHVVLTLLVRGTESLREAIDAVRWSNASNWSDLTARKSAYGKPRKNSLILHPHRMTKASGRDLLSVSRTYG